jgi:hypothetical protein
MEDIITLNTRQPDHGRLLRTALLVNALYSGLSGATLAVASPFIGPWVGLDGWVLLAVGVGLVGYAAVLAIARGQARLLPIVGRLAVGADLVWVAGAAALILIGDVLTGQGDLALALLTGGVGVLAAVQVLGLRQLAGETAGAA